MTDKVKEYCEKNREKLRRLARHGEPTVRAMALAVLKRGNEEEFEELKKEKKGDQA